MKLTRGQIRAFEHRTVGFVDSLLCEVEAKDNGSAILKFHHLEIEAWPDGSWTAIAIDGDRRIVINQGAIDPVTNEGWFANG